MTRLFHACLNNGSRCAVSHPKRQLHLDLLKLLGAQLIVWHHFSLYGPAAQVLHNAAPGLMAWLHEYARMAVQIFLVVGGFLAAQHLSQPMETRWQAVAARVGLRYRRLVLPFMVAMLLAVLSAAVSRAHLPSDGFVPDAPSTVQVLAHALLLHDVLGQPALSTGVWYVAIDLQLFAMLTVLVWLGSVLRPGPVASTLRSPAWPAITWALVAGLAALSLLVLNRMAALDAYAPYFFGAYGLGILSYGIARTARTAHATYGLLLALTCLGVLALVVDYRERIVLALGVAMVLALGGAWPAHMAKWPVWLQQLIARGGQVSYAQFLNHFALLMLGNAGFTLAVQAWALGPTQQVALAGVVLAAYWLLSLWLGAWFERHIEGPLSHWRSHRA